MRGESAAPRTGVVSGRASTTGTGRELVGLRGDRSGRNLDKSSRVRQDECPIGRVANHRLWLFPVSFDVQKKSPFHSLSSSRRDRSVLERRKRVKDARALSRVLRSVFYSFGVSSSLACIWYGFWDLDKNPERLNSPLEASSRTKGVFCKSVIARDYPGQCRGYSMLCFSIWWTMLSQASTVFSLFFLADELLGPGCADSKILELFCWNNIYQLVSLFNWIKKTVLLNDETSSR